MKYKLHEDSNRIDSFFYEKKGNVTLYNCYWMTKQETALTNPDFTGASEFNDFDEDSPKFILTLNDTSVLGDKGEYQQIFQELIHWVNSDEQFSQEMVEHDYDKRVILKNISANQLIQVIDNSEFISIISKNLKGRFSVNLNPNL